MASARLRLQGMFIGSSYDFMYHGNSYLLFDISALLTYLTGSLSLAGNLLGTVANSAAEITDVSAINNVATNIIKSDNETKEEPSIEANVETAEQDGTRTTVEAKVEVKVSEIPDTAEGATTPVLLNTTETGSSDSTVATVVETIVEAGSEELKEAIVESTAAIQKSEAALVESTVALAETQTSLVESAVALGKTEAVLAESKAAVTEVLESKAALVTSALDLGKSRDSLVKSAISLGKSRSSLFGTVLKFGDKTGEAFGVDLIDDKLYEDGIEDGGKLTGWDKVKSEVSPEICISVLSVNSLGFGY